MIQPTRTAVAAVRILFREYGYWQSVRRRAPVDAAGNPVPWLTYPAVEYLDQFDFSAKTVFEFGAGQSTRFWCARAARVVSVESNPVWYERVRGQMAANGAIYLVPEPGRYAQRLAQETDRFDVIVVDGIERRACCAEAVQKLRPGGLIILDNADWHHHCAALLRAAGLLEVDMTGFGPCNGYTWTTSLFFHREFAFPLRGNRQPLHGRGSLPHLESA